MLLRSERLTFRNWKASDLPLALSLWGDRYIMQYAGGALSSAAVEKRLNTEIQNFEKYGIQYWPMFNAEKFIGCCGLKPYDVDNKIYKLGYYIVQDEWQKGYASEACKAVVNYAFNTQLNSATLFAVHHPLNEGSKRVLLGAGFMYSHHKFFELNGVEEPCYFLHKK
jgi:[ribosomal protein S5]-alanine N-acetyltransferase